MPPQPATNYNAAPQTTMRVPAPPRNTDRYDEYIGVFTADGNPPPDPYA